LKLLLDEHISPSIAVALSKNRSRIDVLAIRDWHHGVFLNQSDDRILAAAQKENRVLVTYDVNTLPDLLIQKAIAEESHAGVIFVSSLSFPQRDIGRITRALTHLAAQASPVSWVNRVVFLTRPSIFVPLS
jgi:predicted nuclease of predicted toxin-antitoxin system